MSLSMKDNRHIARFLGLVVIPHFNVLYNDMPCPSLMMITPNIVGRCKTA
jgi:hypothetical protein